MVDIQTVSIAIASAGVLVGVVYYVLQIRQQTIMRKTNLMIAMYSWIQSKEYQEAVRIVVNSPFKDYEDYVKKYGSSSSDAPIHTAIMRACSPMDMMGTLLYRRQIDILFVHDLWGIGTIKMLHEKVKPIILGWSREFDEPSFLWI